MAGIHCNQKINGFKPNTTLNLGHCPPTLTPYLLPETLHFPIDSGSIVVIHPAIANTLINQYK
jgi:hypothetical protein